MIYQCAVDGTERGHAAGEDAHRWSSGRLSDSGERGHGNARKGRKENNKWIELHIAILTLAKSARDTETIAMGKTMFESRGMKMETNREQRIIWGKFEGDPRVFTWKVPDGKMHELHEIHVGDYAVVETLKGFGLVEVVAVGVTDFDHETDVTQRNGRIKSIVVGIYHKDHLKDLCNSLKRNIKEEERDNDDMLRLE